VKDLLMNWTPEILAAELTKRGEDWADKNAAADLLEENKKTLLAELTLQWPQDSMAKAEARAKAACRYLEHIKLMVEARRQANKARVSYDSIRAFEGMWRTNESTKRAELGLR
jgi:lambda repressor-like predicted transcriptional regulator